jgi:CheY-like chemotaxis protein
MQEPRPRLRRRRAAGGARVATEVAPAAPPSPALKRSGRRALLVEGDAGTQRLCREVLESSGFVVDAVDSGIAAVVAARAGLPDLILIDLQLRDVPGREAIRWFRSNPALRSTPIIVLTTTAEDHEDLAQTGPGATLRKPLSAAMIRRTIREAVK